MLQLDADGRLGVLPSLPPDAPCPLIDIALRADERGVGMCTDVALYVIHTRARVIPLLAGEQMEQYTARCGSHTARMFLESMYHEWLSPGHSSLHLMQASKGPWDCLVWGCRYQRPSLPPVGALSVGSSAEQLRAD